MTTPPRRGRPPGPKTQTHGVRCTAAGWAWLQRAAKAAGCPSVGAWATAMVEKKTRHGEKSSQ